MTAATNEGMADAVRQIVQYKKPHGFLAYRRSDDVFENHMNADTYVEKFETECKAYNVADLYEAFTLVQGPSSIREIEELMPEPEEGTKWEKLKKQFLDFHQPSKMTASFRNNFHQSVQKARESNMSFARRLRRQVKYCGFSDSTLAKAERAKLELTALLAQIGHGSTNEKVRKKALTDDCKWNDLIALIREQDAAQAQMDALDDRKSIRKISHQSSKFKSHSGYSKPARTEQSKDCFFCGNGIHDRSNCPAKNVRCAACGKIGHLKLSCLNSTRPSRNQKPFKKPIRKIYEDVPEEDEEEHHEEDEEDDYYGSAYGSECSYNDDEQASGFVRHVNKQANFY